MVEKALQKLNVGQLAYCKTMSEMIENARVAGAALEWEKRSGKLRGFLECLCQMEIISGQELKALYAWFMAENRNQ